MLANVAKLPECCGQSEHHRRLEQAVLSGYQDTLTSSLVLFVG